MIKAVRERPQELGYLGDCGRCLRENDVEQRRLLGCGFAPPAPRRSLWTPASVVQGWQPPRDDEGRALIPSVCAGYTTSLPAVQEIARARVHRAILRDFCDGEQPHPQMFEGIEILEGATIELQELTMPKPKAGG